MSLPRETGSSLPTHDTADPRCEKAVAEGLDESHTCQLCADSSVREQAAVAINVREIGS